VLLNRCEPPAHPWELPSLAVHHNWHPNELVMVRHAQETAEAVLRAEGATTLFPQSPVQVHMMGTDPRPAVTDTTGRSHAVENLYVAGGALFPTGSSVNPTLTILALAWRTAEAIAGAVGARASRFAVRGDPGPPAKPSSISRPPSEARRGSTTPMDPQGGSKELQRS